MATEINAGRVAMVPKGEWSASTAYVRLDVVQYNGSSYVAIQDSTGQNPSTATTYWQLLAGGVDPSNYYTKTETNTKLGSKQDALVSGQNIKSINGQSVLGEGNLEFGELFVVTMTRHNSVYTADKSVSEIYEASYTNGKPVIAIMHDINNPVFILTDCNPDGDSYVFSSIESNSVTTLRWQQHADDYTYELETIVLQPHLVSGTNIKTLNNETLLGSGNVTISGKSAYQSYVDTTTDSPVKTEAEWVASLKGEDGVSLGEVAIADNLTEGGSDKVLSAEMGKVIREQVETLLHALGDYAFPDGKPTLNWSSSEIKHSISATFTDLTAASIWVNGESVLSLPAQIDEGDSLSFKLTVSDNLHIIDDDNLVITMGGVNIKSSAYNPSTGEITVSSVTDNLVITASAITYLQTGLVFQLDGLSQGGTEGHWIDLVGGIDFVPLNSGASSGANCWNFDGNSLMTTTGTPDFDNLTHTIEIVFKTTSSLSGVNAILFQPSTAQKIGFSHSSNNVITICGFSADGTTRPKNLSRLSADAGNYIYSCNKDRGVANGQSLTLKGSFYNFALGDCATIGARYASSQTPSIRLPFTGKIYAIRIYSSLMTVEQMQQNQKIDNIRFSLGLNI